MLKTYLFCICILTTLFGCQHAVRKIDFINVSTLTETPLRYSGFFVKHPVALQLSVDEWYQKEQKSNFWFCKKDSLPPYSNTFAIGLNVPDTVKLMGYDLPIIEQVQSEVLGALVKWNIRKSDTGYYVADGRLRETARILEADQPRVLRHRFVLARRGRADEADLFSAGEQQAEVRSILARAQHLKR